MEEQLFRTTRMR